MLGFFYRSIRPLKQLNWLLTLFSHSSNANNSWSLISYSKDFHLCTKGSSVHKGYFLPGYVLNWLLQEWESDKNMASTYDQIACTRLYVVGLVGKAFIFHASTFESYWKWRSKAKGNVHNFSSIQQYLMIGEKVELDFYWSNF